VARDEMLNPYWMENNPENRNKCRLLAEAKTDAIPEPEVAYWNSFIDKYLRPLNEDKEEQKRISQGLLELRNQGSKDDIRNSLPSSF
jgi:chitin synthase